jgi:hypothetical protein
MALGGSKCEAFESFNNNGMSFILHSRNISCVAILYKKNLMKRLNSKMTY